MPPRAEPGIRQAIERRDAGALRILLEAERAKPQSVIDAARTFWVEGLKLMRAAGGDMNGMYRGYRPLHACIQENGHKPGVQESSGQKECLRWLLKHGANPELTAAWPAARALLVAAFTGTPWLTEELVSGGAKTDGFTAAGFGEVDEVRRALRKDPGFAVARDNGTLTALQCCAGSRLCPAQLEIASLLLDHGADIKALTPSWSHEIDAVYLAAHSHSVRLFDLLLERGGDATAALPAAAWQKEMDLAEIALKHGARINEARDGKKPLLNELIRWGQFHAAFWLLEHGADPNLPDERGWTAVHQAASRGNERMLKAVLGAGGDARRKSLQGETPRDIARGAGKPKIIALF
jgi:hypothetical protein